MAIATQQLTSEPLTYEQYMAEEETNQRYDIVDGVRIVTNPTRRHQRILFHLARRFEDYARSALTGQVVIAACDVLISKAPLRTRQPDVLFISNARLAQNPPDTNPAPLSPAPELVVEILSPSDTRTVLDDKLADYRSVGVLECWVVSPGARTVEILRLTEANVESVETYGEGEAVRSIIFAGLQLDVADIFAD